MHITGVVTLLTNPHNQPIVEVAPIVSPTNAASKPPLVRWQETTVVSKPHSSAVSHSSRAPVFAKTGRPLCRRQSEKPGSLKQQATTPPKVAHHSWKVAHNYKPLACKECTTTKTPPPRPRLERRPDRSGARTASTHRVDRDTRDPQGPIGNIGAYLEAIRARWGLLGV